MKTEVDDYFERELATPVVSRSARKKKPAKRPAFPPDMDILLWVRGNAPMDLKELKAIRYSLYHRCSRDGFKISGKMGRDDFRISGRASKLHVVNNQARRYVLWRLRILRKEKPWLFDGTPNVVDPLRR